MDIRTGKTYETFEKALEAGVPESDVAQILERRLSNGEPIVKFSKGSFKSFVRNPTTKELVRADECPSCGGYLRGSFPTCSACQLVEALKGGG